MSPEKQKQASHYLIDKPVDEYTQVDRWLDYALRRIGKQEHQIKMLQMSNDVLKQMVLELRTRPGGDEYAD